MHVHGSPATQNLTLVFLLPSHGSCQTPLPQLWKPALPLPDKRSSWVPIHVRVAAQSMTKVLHSTTLTSPLLPMSMHTLHQDTPDTLCPDLGCFVCSCHQPVWSPTSAYISTSYRSDVAPVMPSLISSIRSPCPLTSECCCQLTQPFTHLAYVAGIYASFVQLDKMSSPRAVTVML